MKKTILILLAFTLSVSIFGQSDKVSDLISQGIALHDDGKYEEAIKKYQEALSIDKNSTSANYEMSYTCLSAGKYEEAVKYSSAVIKLNKNSVEDACIILGSALDYLHESKKAIEAYKKGIKKFPNSYLLNYNLALTYFNLSEYDDAENAVINAILLMPSHASSHLLLSSIEKSKGQRVKSLLPLFYFLMLEPDSKRAQTCYNDLVNQLGTGVEKKDEKNINVTISSDTKKDDFSSVNMLISLLAASKYTETNKDKTEMQLFAEHNKSIFGILSEINNKNNDFWWNFYASKFKDLVKTDNDEAFSYYISQSKKEESVDKWISENSEKLYRFEDWMKKNAMQ